MSNRRTFNLATATLLVAGLTLTFANSDVATRKQVERRRLEKEYRAAGFPWEVADLHLSFPNSSSVPLSVVLRQKDLSREEKDAATAIRSGDKSQAKGILKKFEPRFSAIASKFRGKSLVLPYQPTVHPRTFKFLTELKSYTRLYSTLGLLNAEIGANKQSIIDFQSAVNIALSCKSDPETITYLVQIALLDIIRSNIGRAAVYAKADAPMLRRLSSLNASLAPSITSKQCCRVEAFDELQIARNNFIRGDSEIAPAAVKDRILTGWAKDKTAIQNQSAVLAYWIKFSASLQHRWDSKSAVRNATVQAQKALSRFKTQKTFVEENFGFDSTGTILHFNGEARRKREAVQIYFEAISTIQKFGIYPTALSGIPMYKRIGPDQHFLQYLPMKSSFTIVVKRDPADGPQFTMAPLMQISFPPNRTDRW